MGLPAATTDTGVASSLVARATYVRDVRPHLPAAAFERARSRLAFLPVQIAFIALATIAIVCSWVPLVAAPLLSMVIGAGFAGMAFVTHELLHGAILADRRWQRVIGWIGFLPFTLSPLLWMRWHNRTHHACANRLDDPDRYPTLDEYHSVRSARLMIDGFSPGGRRWRGVLSLAFGFTMQSAIVLVSARRRGILTTRELRVVLAETLLQMAVWTTIAVTIGFVAFVFVYAIPLAVGNACVMAFILTNHTLSPVVEIDDPLASGLSVTMSRPMEWLTLGFGYHVEHHLFPSMSTRHARAVRAVLRARWPASYRSMPLGEALRRLHRSARVYKNATTLIDPRTGREHATL
jgi:fatty acid desaturase